MYCSYINFLTLFNQTVYTAGSLKNMNMNKYLSFPLVNKYMNHKKGHNICQSCNFRILLHKCIKVTRKISVGIRQHERSHSVTSDFEYLWKHHQSQACLFEDWGRENVAVTVFTNGKFLAIINSSFYLSCFLQ